jgi:hypothetical protein
MKVKISAPNNSSTKMVVWEGAVELKPNCVCIFENG